MAFEVKDDNIEELLKGDLPVVIDFSAAWCGPCKQVAPIIEELAEEYAGKVVVGKCDIDENADVTSMYRIMSVPTILFIKNGEVVDKHVGAGQKASLKTKIDALL